MESIPMTDVLIPLAASGADAQQLLEAAYPYFKRPLALVDDLFRVVAFYGPGIPPEDCRRRNDTDPAQKAEWHRKVNSSDEPVIDDQGGGPYRAMCLDVRFNGIAVERLAMMETVPFTAADSPALKQLSAVLALQYAGSVSNLTSNRDHERSSLLLALIRGEQPADSLQAMMDALSIPRSGSIRLMAFGTEARDADYRTARKHLLRLFDAILAEEDGRLLCLTGDAEFCEMQPEIAEEARALGLKCGVSRSFSHLADVRGYYRQSLAAMRTAVRKNEPLIRYDDCLADDLIMLCSRDRDPVTFCRPEILRLADYDAANHTELLKTLICYLECLCNMAETSRKSFLHYNTIKYRLKLISEISGIGDISSEDLCEFMLSVRILDYLNGGNAKERA